MHVLRQSVQCKGLLLLLLVMSPVDLDSRLRSGRPPSPRRSLTTGGTDRGITAGGASIYTNTTAAEPSDSTNKTRSLIIMASAGPCIAGNQMGCRNEQVLASPSIGSGFIGVAAAESGADTLRWGGSGEFAGEVCH